MTRATIAAREEEIAIAKQQISALQTKIASIQDDIAAKKAFIAPIRRLPFEILGEIVAVCATRDASPQVLRTLSSICRTWRDATLRTPKAWTRIIIDTQKYYADHRTRLHTVRDLQEWLDRSGTCTKDLDLSLTYATADDRKLLLSLVQQHAHELRSLRLDQGQRTDCDIYYQPMPCLEALDLLHDLRNDAKTQSTLILRAGRLRLLRLRSIHAKLPQSTEDQLEYLELAHSSTDELFWHASLSSLKYLSVEEFRADTLAPSNELALPQLKSLELRFDTNFDRVLIPDIATAVFANLRMPKLETLCLRLDGRQPSKKDVAVMLRALLSGSNPPLRTMQLKNLCTSDTETINILDQLPDLEYLALLDLKISDKVIDALVTPKRAGWLCPKLARIHIATHESKSNKFVVSQNGMQGLAVARDDAVRASAARGEEPPVAELVGVRNGRSVLVRQGTDMRWEHVGHDHDTKGIRRAGGFPSPQRRSFSTSTFDFVAMEYCTRQFSNSLPASSICIGLRKYCDPRPRRRAVDLGAV